MDLLIFFTYLCHFDLGDWLNGIREGVGTEIRQRFSYSGAFLEDLVSRHLHPLCAHPM